MCVGTGTQLARRELPSGQGRRRGPCGGYLIITREKLVRWVAEERRLGGSGEAGWAQGFVEALNAGLLQRPDELSTLTTKSKGAWLLDGRPCRSTAERRRNEVEVHRGQVETQRRLGYRHPSERPTPLFGVVVGLQARWRSLICPAVDSTSHDSLARVPL